MGILYNHPAAEEGTHQDVFQNMQAVVLDTRVIFLCTVNCKACIINEFKSVD